VGQAGFCLWRRLACQEFLRSIHTGRLYGQEPLRVVKSRGTDFFGFNNSKDQQSPWNRLLNAKRSSLAEDVFSFL
jgi:hypothetical protein